MFSIYAIRHFNLALGTSSFFPGNFILLGKSIDTIGLLSTLSLLARTKNKKQN